MTPARSADVPANRCGNCGGLWIDVAVVEHHVRGTELAEVLSGRTTTALFEDGPRLEVSCPRCATKSLVRHDDGEAQFDACATCRGLFIAADAVDVLVRRREPSASDATPTEEAQQFDVLAWVVEVAAGAAGLHLAGAVAGRVLQGRYLVQKRSWRPSKRGAAIASTLTLAILLAVGAIWELQPGRRLHSWILGPDIRIGAVSISRASYVDIPPARPIAVMQIENVTDDTLSGCRVSWIDKDSRATSWSEPFWLPPGTTTDLTTEGPPFWRADTFRTSLQVRCEETVSPPRSERVTVRLEARRAVPVPAED